MKFQAFSIELKMLEKLLLFAVIFGAIRSAPQGGLPPAGQWFIIPQLDIDLVGLCVRGINFINNDLQLSPAFR